MVTKSTENDRERQDKERTSNSAKQSVKLKQLPQQKQRNVRDVTSHSNDLDKRLLSFSAKSYKNLLFPLNSEKLWFEEVITFV